MCIFILQTMSAEPTFGKSLNMKFEAQETLPQSIRLAKFRGSYADYLIMVCSTSQVHHLQLLTLTFIVGPQPDGNKQRKPRHCLSRSARDPQQYCSIRSARFCGCLLKDHSALFFDVCAQLLIGQ